MSAAEIRVNDLVYVKPVVCLGQTLIKEQQGFVEKVFRSNEYGRQTIYLVSLSLEHRQVEMFRSGFTKH